MKARSLKNAFLKGLLPFFLVVAFAQQAVAQDNSNSLLDEEFTHGVTKVDTVSHRIGIRSPVFQDSNNPNGYRGQYIKLIFEEHALKTVIVPFDVTPQEGRDEVTIPDESVQIKIINPYHEGETAESAFRQHLGEMNKAEINFGSISL